MRIIPSFDNSPSSIKQRSRKQSGSVKGFSRLIESTQPDEQVLDSIFEDDDRVLENIYMLAEEMEKAGEDLSEKPTPEHFAKYKKYVSLIVKSTLRNMRIQERHVRSFANPRIFKTVQDIDESLADLAGRILGDEKSRLVLLQLTTHIKGLVMSLLA
ncbi:MAG: DUF327 family protein [Brevinema sp.]